MSDRIWGRRRRRYGQACLNFCLHLRLYLSSRVVLRLLALIGSASLLLSILRLLSSMDPRYTTTLGTGPHPTSPRPSSFEMGVGRQDAKKRGKGDGAPSSLSSSSPPDYAYAAAPLSSPIITSKRETATSHLPPRPPSPLTTFTVMCITEASSSSHLCRDFSRSGGERKRAKRGIAGLGLRAGLDGARTRSGVSQYATGGMHLHEGEAVVGVEVEVGDEERQTEASTYLPAYGIHVQAVNPFTVRGRERMRALRPPSHVVHAIIADGASPSLCSSLPMWRRKSSKIADDAIIVGCFTHALPVPPQLPLYSISGENSVAPPYPSPPHP
mmetsp:Transcript_42419/g.109120  ORF Transcript_42419/g.109120 Transcript_42419/m.109120 type:complete len:327 (-) Transcript_42419:20-1000(-)